MPPPSGFCKINFDAAFDGDFATVGMILRNLAGVIAKAWIGILMASTPYEAEAIAILQALRWAERQQLTHVVFEGDASNVILVVTGLDEFVEWQGRRHILKGRTFLSKYIFWQVAHVGRHCNRVAHNLASWANSCNTFGNSDPVELPPAVFCDKGGTPGSDCTDLAVVLDLIDGV